MENRNELKDNNKEVVVNCLKPVAKNLKKYFKENVEIDFISSKEFKESIDSYDEIILRINFPVDPEKVDLLLKNNKIMGIEEFKEKSSRFGKVIHEGNSILIEVRKSEKE
ncbi:hypothetical protein [Mangrovimonas xylaniphaga]|uniref:hypothetical protein n=1 Tax=Mangrovimonas xylaniphaga TaxID=1645915 RepID=UPI0006B456D7|nr:hypothetical protein [Mangrovimonas xylaniphaga]